MSRDFELAQNFRSRTLKFVRQSLGFADSEEVVVLEPPESDRIITSFETVGQALMTSYTLSRSYAWQRGMGQQKELTAL